MTGKHDHGGGRAAIEEEGLLQGSSEMVEAVRGEEEAVESMSVTDLKAKAAEVRLYLDSVSPLARAGILFFDSRHLQRD